VDIAWFRDLVIIIEGIIAIALLIILIVLALKLFKRINRIGDSAEKLTESVQEVVDSARATVDNIAAVSSFARSEMATPLMRVAAVVQGISKGLDTVMGFFRKGKGGE
jgi:hypothetical protein